MRHGYGTHVYADESSFEGHWVKDQKHGSGCERYLSGAIFLGSFANNLRHGQGTSIINDCKHSKVIYEHGNLVEEKVVPYKFEKVTVDLSKKVKKHALEHEGYIFVQEVHQDESGFEQVVQSQKSGTKLKRKVLFLANLKILCISSSVLLVLSIYFRSRTMSIVCKYWSLYLFRCIHR